jgi:hypothetical protein
MEFGAQVAVAVAACSLRAEDFVRPFESQARVQFSVTAAPARS